MARYLLVLAMPLLLNAAAAQTSTPAPAQAPPVATPAPEYQVGITTIADVAAKLGKPGSVTTMSDDTKVIAWVSSKTHVKGSSFVPIVGLFAGGAKSHMVVRVFTFGPDGLLKSFTSTDSSADCAAGITGVNCH